MQHPQIRFLPEPSHILSFFLNLHIISVFILGFILFTIVHEVLYYWLIDWLIDWCLQRLLYSWRWSKHCWIFQRNPKWRWCLYSVKIWVSEHCKRYLEQVVNFIICLIWNVCIIIWALQQNLLCMYINFLAVAWCCAGSTPMEYRAT